MGLPETAGVAGDTNVTAPSGYDWCLPPRNIEVSNFYDPNISRNVTITGTWVIVADGTQTNSEITVPSMYAASFAGTFSGDRSSSILPANIILRVSTLDCHINIPTNINFGAVTFNPTVDSELASRTDQLIVTCTQENDLSTSVNANVNLQFHPISGVFEDDDTQLALNQGGGYITGEISDGITSSGECGSAAGIYFDREPIEIGQITKTDSYKSFEHQITWRLCSGGDELPLGPVTAAADMIVTFN